QTFANASSTLFSSTIASTSQLWLSGASDGCLTVSGSKVSSTGVTCGTLTAMTFAFPFTKFGSDQSTTTLIHFFGGLNSTASSTIGAGTTASGLTIFGGATTTGDFL